MFVTWLVFKIALENMIQINTTHNNCNAATSVACTVYYNISKNTVVDHTLLRYIRSDYIDSAVA